jgi:Uma2 family endonuclease
MVFVYNRSAESRRVKRQPGLEGGHVGLIATPDMVLEVVRDSSEIKDKVTLREACWEAGITEHWIVDARGDKLEFEILKRGQKNSIVTRKQNGWSKSTVFGKFFKLLSQQNPRGNRSSPCTSSKHQHSSFNSCMR